MKKLFYAAMIPAISLLWSCDNNRSTTDTTSTTETTVSADSTGSMSNMSDNTNNKMGTDTMNTSGTTAATGTPVTAKDVTDFVQKAIPGGMKEVEMGRMAASQGQHQRVKDYGNMLVTDHTQAGDELKSMAMKNSIAIPAAPMPDHKEHMDMLGKKTGADFDKAYMDMMIKDHKKDIDEYKKASTSLSEESYKSYAAKTLPVLQKHLDSAQAIRKALK